MIDYHVHERHSRDATTAYIRDYAWAAEESGISEIAFTTHLITTGPDTDVSIMIPELPEYVREIQKAQETTNVKLLIGLEVDYFSEEEQLLERILSQYPFDFILGSTHYINGVDIGARGQAERFFKGRSISEAADEYYIVWKQAIESGLFDVMAHPDYWRKYLHLFRSPANWSDFGNVVYDALDSLDENNVGIEVNTAGHRHGMGGAFPMLEFLIAAKEAGVNIVTTGSDSHTIGTLGLRIEEALKMLKNCGFNEVSTFYKRRNKKVDIDQLLVNIRVVR